MIRHGPKNCHLLLLTLLLICNSIITNGEPIDLPSVRLDAVGQLGFAGDYAGISPFKDTRQFESIPDPDVYSIILENNGTFDLLASANGAIFATCAMDAGDQVYIGGQFTMLNNTPISNIARFDTATGVLSPLGQGLDGAVRSLLCDTDAVYVGGDFTAPVGVSNDSLPFYGGHAAIWQPSNNTWLPVPWRGFNGPVYTITRNQAMQTILFGGRFDATGDGQYYNSNTSQPVNLNSPTQVSAGNGAVSGNFSNPSSIICPSTNGTENTPWLLQDGVPGYWEASFAYPIQPSVFRIANTHYEGRGTQTFSIIALGSNDYFELSYIDPVTHETTTCSRYCTLSDDTNIAYQDFTVLNPITTSGVRIQIDSWYGAGGGLDSVQIFQSDITVHATVGNTGSSCPNSPSASTSVTGNWQEQFVYGIYQNFLTTTFPATELSTSNASVTYNPYIPVQGQYEVYAVTPGCVGSSTCNQRTQVDLELRFSPGSGPTTVTVDQTNTEDTTTLIYSGFIEASSDAFQPTITLTVAHNATASGYIVTLVADSFRFIRNGTNTTLVSILEYSPQNYTQNITPAWRPLADQLMSGSTVFSIDATAGNTLYIGGAFSSLNNTYRSIVSYDYLSDGGRMVALPGMGVNGSVYDVALLGNSLFIGGVFDNSATGSVEGSFNNVAQIDLTSGAWSALDMGVNGPVNNIIISPDNATITLSGNFSQVLSNTPVTTGVSGNALWSVAERHWIDRSSLLVGKIVANPQLDNNTSLFVGGIRAAQTYRSIAVSSMNVNSMWGPYFLSSASDVVNAGVFWHNTTGGENKTVTIIGGKFQMGDIMNLALYQDGEWRGIGQLEGQVNSLAIIQDQLYIGGQFNGTFGDSQPKSFAIYNLATQTNEDVTSVYGPDGSPGQINVIRTQPDGKAIYIGGNFTSVGSLTCPSVCKLDTQARQWNNVALGISGHVYDLAVTQNQVTAVGDISINNNPTRIARMQSQGNLWTAMSLDAETSNIGIPTAVLNGPDNVIVAGSNDTAGFIGTWDGQNFASLDTHLGPSTDIRQLLFMPISSSKSKARYPAGSEDMLLVIGHLNLQTYGNVSVALYDGNHWYPFVLSSRIDGTPGYIRNVFHETDCCAVPTVVRHLPIPAVILISIAISLGLIFVLVAAGMVALLAKRKYGDPDAPEPMPPYVPGQNRPSSLAAMLDAAQACTLGSGAAAAIAGATAAAAGPSKEKHASRGSASNPDSGQASGGVGENAAGAASGATAFSALVAAAKANTNSNEPASEESPRLYYAKYPFEAKEFGELGFGAAEPIVVTDTSDSVWWMGYKDDGTGKPISGLFPSNYVTDTKPDS